MGDAVKMPLLLPVHAGGQGAAGREREGGSQWPGDLSGARARAPQAAGGGLCRGVALRTPPLARAGGQAASPGARGAVPAGSAAGAPGL